MGQREPFQMFHGFKIVEGMPTEYYGWCDGFYIWDNGSLNKKAVDENLKCRGWFKNLEKLKNIIFLAGT